MPFYIANLTSKTLFSLIIHFKCSYFASTSDLRYTVKVSVSSWGLRRLIFLSWSKSLRKGDKEFSARKGSYCSNLTFMSTWCSTILLLLICCTKKVKLSTSNRTDNMKQVISRRLLKTTVFQTQKSKSCLHTMKYWRQSIKTLYNKTSNEWYVCNW